MKDWTIEAVMIATEALTVLNFAASQPLLTRAQTEFLLAPSADTGRSILDQLTSTRLLDQRQLLPGAAIYAITRQGLAEVGRDLPPPRLDPRDARRVLAAGWVWLRARDGRFEGVEVLSERELVAHDSVGVGEIRGAAERGDRYGLRVPGFPSENEAGLHYPDVLLRFPDALLAVYVELVMPSPRWLRALLRAYGADERYHRVVFLVEDERVAQVIEGVARSVGVAGLVAVHWMEWPAPEA